MPSLNRTFPPILTSVYLAGRFFETDYGGFFTEQFEGAVLDQICDRKERRGSGPVQSGPVFGPISPHCLMLEDGVTMP